MQVFVAWSGDASKALAAGLARWLPKVIQSLEPFISTSSIDSGSRWRTEIGDKLSGISFGVLCLTPDNLASPWIHFEAGALSKNIDHARVVPLLLDVRTDQVRAPLDQFQAEAANDDGIGKLVRTINRQLQKPLEEGNLDEAIERWLPDFRKVIADAQAVLSRDRPATAPGPTMQEMLQELLNTARSNSRDISDLKQELAKAKLAFNPQVIRHGLLSGGLPGGSWTDVTNPGLALTSTMESVAAEADRTANALAAYAAGPTVGGILGSNVRIADVASKAPREVTIKIPGAETNKKL